MNIPTGHNLRVLYNNELLVFFPPLLYPPRFNMTVKLGSHREQMLTGNNKKCNVEYIFRRLFNFHSIEIKQIKHENHLNIYLTLHFCLPVSICSLGDPNFYNLFV